MDEFAARQRIDEKNNEEDSTAIETKIDQLEEQILKEPPVEPKKRKKRTMTPEMLKKLELARIKSIEVKKKNAEMKNKAKLLKRESDKLKIELLHKTEKELEVLKEKLNKPAQDTDQFASPNIEELTSEPKLEKEEEAKHIEVEATKPESPNEFSSAESSDEEIVIQKKPKSKNKRKTKKFIIKDDSDTESESEILQLTQKQLKKLLLKESLDEDEFSKTFTKSYEFASPSARRIEDKMNKLERKNTTFVKEELASHSAPRIDEPKEVTLEDIYKRPNNYLNNEAIQSLSGKKVINRRNGHTDAFEVARVKIQPTIIDMKPKSVMKRGIDFSIKDDDPGYKNLFGRGLYE